MAEEKIETVATEEASEKPVKKTTRKRTVKKAETAETAEKKAPAKKTTRKRTVKKAEPAAEEVKEEKAEVTAEEKPAKKTTRKKTAKTVKKVEEKKPEVTFKTRPATIKDFDLILGPVVTEKTQNLSVNNNTVVLKVAKKATADEVKAAVQAIFGVKVDRVNIVNVLPRAKRATRYAGRVPGYKKAYVKVNKEFNLGDIAKTAQENA